MAKDRRDPPKGRAPEPFRNNPFKALKLEKKAPPPAPAKKAAPSPPPAPRPAPRTPEEDEAALFLSAVGPVERVKGPQPVVDVKTPRPPPMPVDDEAEAYLRLAELVAGEGPFELVRRGGSIEGTAPGVDRGVLDRLRRGDFAVQNRLDLHGLARADARGAIERFVADSARAGKRCVLLVHGRGLNPEEALAPLEEQLKDWLTRGRSA
ncbi:MAG: Smr/MutS family protein, partial [Myxococcales bacterium]